MSLIIAMLALFGNTIQYQKGFDFCKKHDFKFPECKMHEKAVKQNFRSKHFTK